MSVVAQPGADLNGRGRRGHRLVAPLQVEHDAVIAGSEHMLDGEAAFDLAFSWFVRFAVARGLRGGSVAPLPFHGGTVILFEIVGPPRSSAVRTTRDGAMLIVGCAFNEIFGRL